MGDSMWTGMEETVPRKAMHKVDALVIAIQTVHYTVLLQGAWAHRVGELCIDTKRS